MDSGDLHPSSSSSAGLENPSATLHQVVCFGRLQDVANSNVREAAQILQCLNPPLRKELRWRALLWCARRHWAVVLRPCLGPDGASARVDGDLLRAGTAGSTAAITSVPPECLYLVFELLVTGSKRDFFLRLSVFPDFKEHRSNVHDLGFCGPLGLHEISERAISVISRYRAYGLIGCNCQHYALDLFHELDIDTPAKITDDQRVEEAAARGIQTYSVVVGIAKGVSASVGVATTGIGCVGVAGVLLLSAHVAAGCAVGFAGGVFLQAGYQWVCRQHRREELAPRTRGGSFTDESSLIVQPQRNEEELLSDWGQLA
mmetsp:Transcript_59228/g.158638  ORF Transcript_59228/g.158638 Transcript_59228/m.158638 type:complete len:316 (-) Transcript_59228:67-1014(-)